MRIQIATELSDAIKARAKASFPNEAFGYLLGHEENEQLIGDELFYPVNVEAFCYPGYVDLQDGWYRAARRRAKQINGRVISSWHSHPYDQKEMQARQPHRPDASPSEADWNSRLSGEIMAICLITETKNHRLRAKLKFWGPMASVIIKET